MWTNKKKKQKQLGCKDSETKTKFEIKLSNWDMVTFLIWQTQFFILL